MTIDGTVSKNAEKIKKTINLLHKWTSLLSIFGTPSVLEINRRHFEVGKPTVKNLVRHRCTGWFGLYW